MRTAAGIRRLAAVLLLLAATLAAGAAEFTASLESAGGAWKVVWTLSDDRPIQGDPVPVLPDLSSFRVLSGPAVGSTTRITNGRGRHEKSWTWRLMPLKATPLTIGPATVEYEGRTLSSRALRLPTSKPAGEESPPVTLVAEVDESRPVPGQPVTLSLRLLFRQSVRQWAAPVLESTPGFLVEPLAAVKEPQVEPYEKDGVSWNSAVLSRWLLVPVREGVLEIPPFAIDVQVEDAGRRRRDPLDDFFGGSFFNGRLSALTAASQPLELRVRPLPDPPAGYGGAVGSFQLSGGPDLDSLAVGEALTLTLTLSGRGNLRWVEAPEPGTSADLERYDTQTEDALQAQSGGWFGRRVWRTLLVPRSPGEMRIDAVELPVWNPARSRWETLSAGPWTVRALPGRSGGAAPGPGFAGGDRVRSYGQDIRHVLDAPPRLERERPPLHHRPGWLIALAACVLLPLGSAGLGRRLERRRGDGAGVRRRELARARRALAAAGDDPAALEAAWRAWLAARLGGSAAGLVLEAAEEDLRRRGVDGERLADGARLRARLELARWGGQAGAGGLGAELRDWIGRVDGELERLEGER